MKVVVTVYFTADRPRTGSCYQFTEKTIEAAAKSAGVWITKPDIQSITIEADKE